VMPTSRYHRCRDQSLRRSHLRHPRDRRRRRRPVDRVRLYRTRRAVRRHDLTATWHSTRTRPRRPRSSAGGGTGRVEPSPSRDLRADMRTFVAKHPPRQRICRQSRCCAGHPRCEHCAPPLPTPGL
jgi:hypothetical protein